MGKFSAGNDIQQKHGRILLLSDAAHSFGATYKDRRTGILADITVFSFHAVKNLTTAEGGALCLNLQNFDNLEVYNHLCVKSLHGQNKDALAKTKKGAWKYDVVEAGYKWNMTDIQAAIGLVGLSHYNDRTLVRRREIFDAYCKGFSEKDWAQLPEFESADKMSSFHIFPLRIKGITEEKRDRIIQGIFDQDVSVNVHFQPLPTLSVYKDLGFNIQDYPVTYDNYSREISLPVYVSLSNDNIQKVIQSVISSVEENLT
jgi:dTDP-4-amino-4,6-dideoxygalactose transaminase